MHDDYCTIILAVRMCAIIIIIIIICSPETVPTQAQKEGGHVQNG